MQTEMILTESETYSTVLVQCTVHNHRYSYIRRYICTYRRTYKFPFIFKKLLLTINNDKYVSTYIHTYVYMKVHLFSILLNSTYNIILLNIFTISRHFFFILCISWFNKNQKVTKMDVISR